MEQGVDLLLFTCRVKSCLCHCVMHMIHSTFLTYLIPHWLWLQLPPHCPFSESLNREGELLSSFITERHYCICFSSFRSLENRPVSFFKSSSWKQKPMRKTESYVPSEKKEINVRLILEICSAKPIQLENYLP